MDIDTFLNGGFENFADRSDAANDDAAAAARKRKSDSAAQQLGGKKRKARPLAAAAPEPAGARSRSSKGAAQRSDAVGQQDDGSRGGPRALVKEVKSHKAQLAALKEADPDFYQYLAESDRALLEFDDESDELDDGLEDGTGADEPSADTKSEDAASKHAADQTAGA